MGIVDSAKQSIRGDNTLISWLGRLFLKLMGWRLEGSAPDLLKYVIIVAPHTSNWDFLILLAMTFALKVRCVWLGKDSIFRPPFGVIFTLLGGIPIDRSSRQSVVEQAVQAFQSRKTMALAIGPEGTRKKTDHWKKGFYYIALGARVPIVFGFADYERKVTGLGPTFVPTGDIQADMEVIRDFYKDIKGKFPEQFSDIRVQVAKD
jgi:1-acyl-sn-glycerol-3-phosphate acyltransferase